MLSNMDDQDSHQNKNKKKKKKKNNEKVKKRYEFFKKQSHEEEFEGQIIKDIVEPYEHKKTENPYVPPAPLDAQTIENKTKNEIDDFLKTASEFNNAAATKQKRDDDITVEGDGRQIIDDVLKLRIYS